MSSSRDPAHRLLQARPDVLTVQPREAPVRQRESDREDSPAPEYGQVGLQSERKGVVGLVVCSGDIEMGEREHPHPTEQEEGERVHEIPGPSDEGRVAGERQPEQPEGEESFHV